MLADWICDVFYHIVHEFLPLTKPGVDLNVSRCCAMGSPAVQGDNLRLSKNIQATGLCNSSFCSRLESPTRALVMEAPKGIEINAEAGSLKATCRTELRLESKDGEVSKGHQALRQKQTKTHMSCRFVAF